MTLQERFNDFYQTLDVDSLQRLGQIYHPRVTFADPVAVHQGLLALDSYFRKLLEGCEHCEFVIRSQQFGESQAFVNWTMTFRSPRLNRGGAIDVDGSSVLGIRNDRIEYQRDYYDMGAMIYEQLPILGSIVRYIRGRMAA
ncbi:MAG: nuclear transport factor 2 family protein [Pseudomonadota bacterium]